MMRDYRASNRHPGTRRLNAVAAMVAGGALALMYYSYTPVSAEDYQPHRLASASTTDLSAPLETTTQIISDLQTVPAPAGIESVPDLKADTAARQIANRYAILLTISKLQQGIEKLSQHESYSVIFEKLERIEGELKDQQEIAMKIRHAPFSVYMKWNTVNKGQQLLFADQQNEGKMLVKLGGLKGRFLPTIKLDPNGDRAKADTRHPVSQAGILNLAKEIVTFRQADLKLEALPNCMITEGQKHNGRLCTKIVVEHQSAKDSPVYRKTITMIDSELMIPIYMRNYTWHTENTVSEEETLIECYSFKDIRLNDQIANSAWEKSNSRYRFR